MRTRMRTRMKRKGSGKRRRRRHKCCFWESKKIPDVVNFMGNA